jgi:hypothetical protein
MTEKLLAPYALQEISKALKEASLGAALTKPVVDAATRIDEIGKEAHAAKALTLKVVADRVARGELTVSEGVLLRAAGSLKGAGTSSLLVDRLTHASFRTIGSEVTRYLHDVAGRLEAALNKGFDELVAIARKQAPHLQGVYGHEDAVRAGTAAVDAWSKLLELEPRRAALFEARSALARHGVLVSDRGTLKTFRSIGDLVVAATPESSAA